ncbi:hypothetical protein DXX93_17410 [Thalassotalea euphylliae]|uniref:MSHA biogenesis protein MshF n=1 Tax=Thalassotalea euphylliae TaxID=1655234 RepID=A0A3E0TW04_9GAMM|nr:hypothetical protein [Thalassotalea euphylliae]REL28165.1 hypothetical protein DXX93_17410 [Thalassotalea euphylliae]
MRRQIAAEHKERTVFELIIIGVLIALLMANFLHSFLKQEGSISEAGFRALGNRFTTQVHAIHGQWLMDGQPSVVKLRDSQGQINQVTVNRFGWPDGDSCEHIWLQVLEMPMSLLNQPISALALNTQSPENNARAVQRVCRYYFSENQYFDYQRHSGKVLL